MKPLKFQRLILYQKIRDNKVMMKYSNKIKVAELLEQNKALQIQIDELKMMKRF